MPNKLFSAQGGKKRPILALAPMAGITDSAFRLLCRQNGADLVYSEMISCEGVIYGRPQEYYDWEKKKWGKLSKTIQLAAFDQKEQPVILQLFGKNPENFAQAAEILIKKFKPDGLDINMGCPAKKVVRSGHGVALMKDPALACQIVQAVKRAAGKKCLVSVKTRLGFTDRREILTLAPKLEKAGLDFLCLHGRTYPQGFSGPVDYQMIKQVKAKLSVPLLANGGIKTPEQAAEVLKLTNADGLAIGLATWGQPWIFQQIKDYLKTGEFSDWTWSQIKRVVLTQAVLAQKNKGRHGIVELRKHLCWYLRGRPQASQWRAQLVRATTAAEVKKILSQID